MDAPSVLLNITEAYALAPPPLSIVHPHRTVVLFSGRPRETSNRARLDGGFEPLASQYQTPRLVAWYTPCDG